MQVWNVLHAAGWKYRTQNFAKNRHLGTIAQLCRAVSSQLRHVSTIGKKTVKQQYLLHISSQYGERWPTNGWDRFTSLGHPSTFQRVSRLGSVTARHSSSGRQPNFAALNRWRDLFSAGRPSRRVLAHILVMVIHKPGSFLRLFNGRYSKRSSLVRTHACGHFLHLQRGSVEYCRQCSDQTGLQTSTSRCLSSLTSITRVLYTCCYATSPNHAINRVQSRLLGIAQKNEVARFTLQHELDCVARSPDVPQSSCPAERRNCLS